jgi:hypothetical protein
MGSSFNSVHPILPDSRQRLGIIRSETIPRVRLVEMSHDLFITRLDQSSEIFGEFIPFTSILLGQFGSNKRTLSSQESSSLAEGWSFAVIGDGNDVCEGLVVEERFDERFIDRTEGLEEGFSKIFFGLGDGSFIVHSLKISQAQSQLVYVHQVGRGDVHLDLE